MTHIFKMDGGKLQNILTLNSGPWECNSDNNSKTSTTSATRVTIHTQTIHGIPQISCELLVFHTS